MYLNNEYLELCFFCKHPILDSKKRFFNKNWVLLGVKGVTLNCHTIHKHVYLAKLSALIVFIKGGSKKAPHIPKRVENCG